MEKLSKFSNLIIFRVKLLKGKEDKLKYVRSIGVALGSKVSSIRTHRFEGIGKRLRIFLLEMTRVSNSTYFASIETASSPSVSFLLASNRAVSQVNACKACYLLSPIGYLLRLHAGFRMVGKDRG